MNQNEFIKNYNDEYREKFNDNLFHRDDNEIIEALKKVILSCERDKYFTLKVEKFTVVEDYAEIIRLLSERELERVKGVEKNNRYNYITLKDSDIKLLVVDYFIRINNGLPEDDKNTGRLRVLIEVPRIVDKYYFRIFGNIYSSMYQIVDGSTYNNSSSSNSKNPNVTLKTMFMATRLYRYKDSVKTTKGEMIDITFYSSTIFSKSLPVIKYLLAKFGLYETMKKLKVPNLMITDYDPDNDNLYTVKGKKKEIYISLPKYIYDNDITAQSLMYTIIKSINKDTDYKTIFTIEYWVKSLGESYGSKIPEKGYSILDSLESIYDISTRESIRLPEEDKKDIYQILIWMIREFSPLRLKDNLDLSTKRIRYSEYIAALYAMKLAKGIYRVSDDGPKIQLSSIKKAINTAPEYLLKTITKDRLVNYRNSVNDLDALAALKYTYKGISGLGEQKGSSIPESYRRVHRSHIGRLDLDSSSATDPGLSGTICPLSTIYNNSFSDYQEPNSWREEIDDLLIKYRELMGLKQVIEFRKELDLPYDRIKDEVISESISSMNKLIRPIIKVENEDYLIRPIIYFDDEINNI